MALEAQEVTVRVRLLGGTAFQREADAVKRKLTELDRAGTSKGLLGSMNRASTVLTSTGAKMRRAGTAITQVGRSMTMLSVPIAYVGYRAVKSAASFQQAMTLLRTQANDSGKDVGYLTKQVLAMSGAYGQTPTALANALYPIISVHLRGKQAIDALKASSMGAAVGLDTATGAADAMTSVFRSRLRDIHSFTQAMNIMDMAVGQGKMHLPQFTQAMTTGVLNEAHLAGIGFGDLASAIAAMSRAGIPPEVVSARMKLTLTKMMAPVGQTAKAFAGLGLSQFQLAHDLRNPKKGLLGALEDLAFHANRLPRDIRDTLLAQAFGQSRGISNVAGLLSVLPEYRQIFGTVSGSSNATLRAHFNQTRATSAFKFKQLQAQIESSLITLGNAILPVLLPLLKQLTGIVKDLTHWFSQLSPGTRSLIVKVMALTVVLGPIVMLFGSLVTAVGGVLSAVGFFAGLVGESGPLASAIPALRGAFMGLLGPIGLVTGALLLLYPSIKHGIKKSVHHIVQNLTHPRKSVRQDLGALATGTGTGSYVPGNIGAPHGASWLNLLGKVPIVGGAIHTAKKLLDMIPGLATGGMTRSPGTVLVGEAGPELLSLPAGAQVTPLPRGNGMFSMPQADLAGSLCGVLQQEITVPLVLDGQVIAKSIARINRDLNNRR